MKERTLVIGYGNPLRGDDGVGWKVAACLTDSYLEEPMEILMVHQLTPELDQNISQMDLVIFVDASHKGIPGHWQCDEVVPRAGEEGGFGHHFGIEALLDYTRAIFHKCPRALAVSITGESFDYREGLSGLVDKAVPEVVKYIQSQVSPLRK